MLACFERSNFPYSTSFTLFLSGVELKFHDEIGRIFEDNKILWKKNVHQFSGLFSPILMAFTLPKKDIIELSEKEPDRDNHSYPSLPHTCDGLHFSMVQFLLGTTTTIPFEARIYQNFHSSYPWARGIPLQSPPSWENTNPREQVAMNSAQNIPPKSHCKWILPFCFTLCNIHHQHLDVLAHAGKKTLQLGSLTKPKSLSARGMSPAFTHALIKALIEKG